MITILPEGGPPSLIDSEEDLFTTIGEDPAVADLLFDALPAVTPPANVKQQVLEQIRRQPAASATIRHAAAMKWKPAGPPGVHQCVLNLDRTNRLVTYLLRMDPGACLPAHHHSGPEQLFILEGAVRIGDAYLSAGDYQHCPAGSDHADIVSATGMPRPRDGATLAVIRSSDAQAPAISRKNHSRTYRNLAAVLHRSNFAGSTVPGIAIPIHVQPGNVAAETIRQVGNDGRRFRNCSEISASRALIRRRVARRVRKMNAAVLIAAVSIVSRLTKNVGSVPCLTTSTIDAISAPSAATASAAARGWKPRALQVGG